LARADEACGKGTAGPAVISEPRQATVSVVIPFYNAASTLAATIASATAQADVDLDVVAVDDGSTDNSLAVARSFGPTIRVFSGPNRGVSAARNRGIAETRGEWIIFLDADDVLLPGTVRIRLDAAEATAADVVICDWQDVVDQDGRAVAGKAKSVDIAALTADAELACARHIWATTAALMYRRSLVKTIGGFRNDLKRKILFDNPHEADLKAAMMKLPLSDRVYMLKEMLAYADVKVLDAFHGRHSQSVRRPLHPARRRAS